MVRKRTVQLPPLQLTFILSTSQNLLRSSHSSIFSTSFKNPTIYTTHRSRNTSPIRAAANKEPPKVKSIYYKNPSKAIEKGGGFYIPGLRGPRLRIFVGLVAGSLLALNHIAGSDVSSANLRLSESLASFAILSVLATVILDIAADGAEQNPRDEDVLPSPEASTADSRERTLEGSGGIAEMPEEVDWATAVSSNLTSARGIAVVRAGRLIYANGEVGSAAPAGAAVERVSQENRSLYVDDSRKLPPEVDFPFLTGSAPAWSVFMVPVNGGREVVVFATDKKPDGKDPSFSGGDRAWLEQMSRRIGRCLSVAEGGA